MKQISFKNLKSIGLGFSFCLLAAHPVPRVGPQATVEAFCAAVSQGDEDAMYGLIVLSKTRQRSIQQQYPGERLSVGEMITGISLSCDPVDLIRSFRVIDCMKTGDNAIAHVEYSIVGAFRREKGKSCATLFSPTPEKTIIETVRLRFADGAEGTGWRGPAWYVEDPDTPKIFSAAILRLCQREFDKFHSIKEGLLKAGKPVPSNIEDGMRMARMKIDAVRIATKVP